MCIFIFATTFIGNFAKYRYSEIPYCHQFNIQMSVHH